MAIDVDLRNERGEVLYSVGDEPNLLGRVLPVAPSASFELLQYVDRWGDCIFNRAQMDSFLRDWSKIEKMANSTSEKVFALAVKRLAIRCREGTHLYLWFVGD